MRLWTHLPSWYDPADSEVRKTFKYHPSEVLEAYGKGLRMCSHEYLPEEETYIETNFKILHYPNHFIVLKKSTQNNFKREHRY